MPVLGVVIEKGGVAKTTTVVTLGVEFARRGARVLVIDLDSQGHAGKALGAARGSGPDVASVIWDDLPAEAAVRSTRIAGLDVIGGARQMGEYASDITQLPGGEQRDLIRKTLVGPLSATYDMVLLDGPPGIGPIHEGIYAACDWVLLPIEPEADAVEGMLDTRQHIEQAREKWRLHVSILGVLATKVEEHTREHRENLEELRAHLGPLLLSPVIRKTTRVREASRERLTISEYDPQATAAQDYRAAAMEILDRMGG